MAQQNLRPVGLWAPPLAQRTIAYVSQAGFPTRRRSIKFCTRDTPSAGIKTIFESLGLHLFLQVSNLAQATHN